MTPETKRKNRFGYLRILWSSEDKKNSRLSHFFFSLPLSLNVMYHTLSHLALSHSGFREFSTAGTAWADKPCTKLQPENTQQIKQVKQTQPRKPPCSLGLCYLAAERQMFAAVSVCVFTRKVRWWLKPEPHTQPVEQNVKNGTRKKRRVNSKDNLIGEVALVAVVASSG